MTMTLVQLLKAAVQELVAHEYGFALAGGLAAGLYRRQPRATGDIDFLLFTAGGEEVHAMAILKQLGIAGTALKDGTLSRAPRMNKKRAPTWVVVGSHKEAEPTVDFMLPSIPWFESAFSRAQANRRQLLANLAPIPCLTAEDIVIAKCFAYESSGTRFKDLDDLQSILENKDIVLDLDYLAGALEALNCRVPSPLWSLAPKALRTLSKRMKGFRPSEGE